jgi:hypothetical protein
MPGQYNTQVSRTEATAAREIKASAHYTYIQNGITLDGSKFAAGTLVLEGQCLVKDNTTGKYEPYTEATAGTFPAGKSDPVILDTSVRFETFGGTNADVIVGAVLVHGAVHTGMLVGVTDKFKEKLAGAIRFV